MIKSNDLASEIADQEHTERNASRDLAERAELALRAEQVAHVATKMRAIGLAETLRWYADELNYYRAPEYTEVGCTLPDSDVQTDGGGRARRSLRDVE